MPSYYCYWCMRELEDKTYLNCPHCGQSLGFSVPKHQLRPGTVLNKEYVVGRALGQGGFGITYLGRDLVLGSRVAIKEYFPSSISTRDHDQTSQVTLTGSDSRDPYEYGRKSFLKEARTLARFETEPGVVRVRRFFEENNTAYLVMDYLDGVTLKQYVKTQGPIPSDRLIDMFLPIMRALSKIHAANMIHRDISPDNIMMMPDGSLCLLDFGLAKDLDSEQSTSIKLKVGYAPEEQYQGRDQGPWTDVYALCATMYFCLTGEKPEDPISRRMADSDSLIKPSAMGIQIRPQDEAALLHGLEVDRRYRFQSMDELAAALTNTQSNSDPLPDPKPAPNPIPPHQPRFPKWLIPAFTVVAAVIIVGVLAITGTFKHQHVWGEWELLSAPDCEHAGVEIRTCTKDATHVEKREVSALGHDWGEWVVQTPPGCDTQGVEARVCRSNSSHVDMRPIPATGHDWMEATIYAPKTCRNCGKQEGDALYDPYQTLVDKCRAFDSGIELPAKSELLDQPLIRYVRGSFGTASGGIYLCRQAIGKDSITKLDNYTQLTLYAVRGSFADGHALVETSDGKLGWVRMDRLSETSDFTY